MTRLADFPPASPAIAEAGRQQLSEQQRAMQQLRPLAKSYRFRVEADAEGFPIIAGRYGQIEWFDGHDLAVYTNRPRLFPKVWSIPGVRRHQTGDSEMRAVFAPEDRAAGRSGGPGEAEADPDLPTEPSEPPIQSRFPVPGGAFD